MRAILVINVGSTSLKYHLYDPAPRALRAAGVIERLGTAAARHRFTRDGDRQSSERPVDAPTVREALELVLAHLGPAAAPASLAGVGHRVVHGGARFTGSVLITDDVKQSIDALAVFAPLHNPPARAGIDAAEALLGGVPQVAAFDTAFHATLPPDAYVYAIPPDIGVDQGLRRYGFHGLAHAHLADRAARHLGGDPARHRLVTCHLGGGASVTAVAGGRSVDTSMGLTPLEGLVMTTRSGDLDPALVLALVRRGMSADAVDDLLNHRSGLAGLSGLSGDLRDLARAAAGADDPAAPEVARRARLAIDVFVHRLRRYIGAFAAVLGGLDALVFSGGIGENAADIRARAAADLAFLGLEIDPARNRSVTASTLAATGGLADISASSRARALVIAADEEGWIARDVARLVGAPA